MEVGSRTCTSSDETDGLFALAALRRGSVWTGDPLDPGPGPLDGGNGGYSESIIRVEGSGETVVLFPVLSRDTGSPIRHWR